MDDERVREGITHKTGQLLFFDVEGNTRMAA
jgi:hypothetical protein